MNSESVCEVKSSHLYTFPSTLFHKVGKAVRFYFYFLKSCKTQKNMKPKGQTVIVQSKTDKTISNRKTQKIGVKVTQFL